MWIIHVNQHLIKHNSKHNTDYPVFRIQNGRVDDFPRYAREVIIKGDSKSVYSPDNPLRCGAKVWIEAEEEPVLIDECVYADIREEMNKKKITF